MAKSITIQDTKGIKNMCFTFPEKKGVYLLVGPNGIGKTTLLVCMDRICNPYAFARGFYHPKNITGYDEYINSTIRYNVDNTCIQFRKKQSKWAASPRKDNAALLKQFGYNESIFIKADSKRIDATAEELGRGRIKQADDVIVRTLNQIFETEKYNNLKKLKVSYGRGRAYSLFNIIKDGRNYYTEKRFSTGEIAILRLVESIETASNGALILLDEAEMALHPRVQINLLNYLKQKSKEKDLMVFISTHSPTMIKATNKNHIILLEPTIDGEIEMCTPCYPAMALGGVDFEESNSFDYVFFVEDDIARLYLKRMIFRYSNLVREHSTALVSIVPVGGFFQTASIAVNTNVQLFGNSKVFALVDEDAFEDIDDKHKFKEIYNKHNNIIRSLGVTPEVKIIETLKEADTSFKRSFKNNMHCEIPVILSSHEYNSCNSTQARQLAKDRFNVFVQKCVDSTGDNQTLVINKIIEMIVDIVPEGEVKKLLGPIFNQH